jgi:hypothetical protein
MKLLLYILLLLPNLTFGKEVEVDTFLVRKEDELALLLKKLRASKSSGELGLNNLNFTEELKEVLKYPGVLDYPFEKLNTMSTVKSPDGEFRLFNWNIEDENQMHSHFCYLVRKGRSGKNQVIAFKEDKFTLGPRPDGMLTPRRWYGALYYKIVPIDIGRKTYYTMFAYNGGTRSSNKKILDVFWFKGKTLRIGYPLFQDERDNETLYNRVFIEYSEKASVSVRFEAKINKIVFDHLMPETPNLKGMYEYYIPDMSYDAYFWKNDFWNYQADIIVGNDREKSRREYYIDKDTGEENFKIVPIDWINPVGGGMGEKHTVADIENGEQDPKKKRKAKKQGQKKDKKEYKILYKGDKKQKRIARKNAKRKKPISNIKLN